MTVQPVTLRASTFANRVSPDAVRRPVIFEGNRERVTAQRPMIRKATVLILGAGASAPYGYPLGVNLVDRIVQLTQPEQPPGGLWPVLVTNTGGAPLVTSFHRRLLRCETSSIDDFLESNPDYREVGKLCIGAALTIWGPLPSNVDHARHWYRYLWERLRQGAPDSEAFRSNAVKIVTYNYDRSFERYFERVLEQTYPDLAAAGAQAARQLREAVLPVVHLHGALGEVADKVLTAPDRMQLNTLEFHRSVAASIRIVHEEKPTGEYQTAHEWLRQAEVVCFLGFGYHPTNVKRLDLLTQIRGRAGVFFGGTAFGLEEAEIARAQAALQLGNGNFLRSDVDALMYLRRYATLE